ncbi:tetraspanin-8-like [Heptranchias perlo]|uniref:tetraspanin-8-like n=1 Tax=Heptranchias perlo TaxID=212740 RepID=UPI00355AA878
MAGVNNCIKYSMFLFNFLFWLCGSIILGVSIWLHVSKDATKITGVNLSEFYSALNLLITVGSIIMVLGFLGCCGAIKESKCMLLLFFIGLLLILALQITAGILGAVYKSQVESMINDTFQELLPLSKQPNNIIKDIEDMQQRMECCGVLNGYEDWNGLSFPPSCNCIPQHAACVIKNGKSVWAQSCLTVMNDLLKANLIIVIGIAFGLAAIELFGLAFSMTLYCQIKNK